MSSFKRPSYLQWILISMYDIIVIVFDRIFTKLVKQSIGVIFNKSGRISTYFRRCQLDDCEISRVASILRIGSVKRWKCVIWGTYYLSTRWHVKFEKLGPLLSSNWHPLMYVLTLAYLKAEAKRNSTELIMYSSNKIKLRFGFIFEKNLFPCYNFWD